MRIESNLDIQSSTYKAYYRQNLDLVQELEAIESKVKEGGGSEVIAKQHAVGKLTARERIARLIDPGSEFFELSLLAGYKLYQDYVPCGGIVTGIARIHGRNCMIVANDQTVKGGTYYPITVKKHLRAQEIAAKNFLPCLYLVDSGGAFLPLQDEVFPDKDHFGRIFYNQAQMSARGIAQLSAVHGFCTAGGAYIPAMSDQSVIVKDNGTIFLAGPPLVEAATGEKISAQDLGGAFVHTQISGVADHYAVNDLHALSILREIVGHLRSPDLARVTCIEATNPRYDPEELLGIVPPQVGKAFAVREFLARLLDDSYFFEFKKNFASTVLCGFAHIEGIPVGVIANDGVLFSDSALKATHFITLCCQEKIPLLFVQNITGFMVGKDAEHGGIAKHGAKMVHAVANAAVPKVTLLVGGSFGAGNYGMCGRAFDPNFLLLWPNAKTSVMGGAQAAQVLCTVKKEQMQKAGKLFSEEDAKTMSEPILAKYEREGHAFYSSARLWDDGVIDPRRSRRTLALALASCLEHEIGRSQFGIFRM